MFWDLGGQEELQSLWDKVSTNLLNNVTVVLHYTLHTYFLCSYS